MYVIQLHISQKFGFQIYGSGLPPVFGAFLPRAQSTSLHKTNLRGADPALESMRGTATALLGCRHTAGGYQAGGARCHRAAAHIPPRSVVPARPRSCLQQAGGCNRGDSKPEDAA